MNCLYQTNYQFPNQNKLYHGKVRDVYTINEKLLVVATDRISAFDHILPRAIPYKGQVLNLIAAFHLKKASSILPVWLEKVPHNNASYGKKCNVIPLEIVVRNYLAGHAWRVYKSGGRELCGVKIPNGLKENDKLPKPIITPATKAIEGHDEDISKNEILDRGILNEREWLKIETAALKLFNLGTNIAEERGLVLVDTKYEFGFYNDELMLIDEIHTPDSSRYFYLNEYDKRQKEGKAQKHLSKEFVRKWLIKNGFSGKEDEKIPQMTDEIVENISKKYIELYKLMIGKPFKGEDIHTIEEKCNEML